jgi:FtsP/CotA-like multicopper oxidase with cupredoxin domain
MKKNHKKIVTIVVITVVLLSLGYLFSMSGHGMDHSAVNEDLMKLPLKTPEDRKPLEFVMKDGIKQFELTVEDIRWEYKKGEFVHAWAYNGQIPGPEIRVEEGEKIRILVKNNIDYEEGTTIHWHGIRLPENDMDGVPGLDQYPIKPGETFVYEYTAKNAGTHFYHSHGSSHLDVAMQDDMGLTGPLTVLPKNKMDIRHPFKYDREYIYMLDEWSVAADGENNAVHMLSEDGEHVHGAEGGHEYNVFTMNGRAFPDTEPLMVKEGERILVRLINSGSKEIHPMHTHGHAFKVIAMDGNIVPRAAQLTMDVITLHPGERRDIVIVADNPGVWLFHCHDTHHAAGGMVMPFFYEGYEPCCMD